MTSLDLAAAQLEFIDLGGYRMAYRQWGDSSSPGAVVLVHGITSSSLSWIRVAPVLAKRLRVVAVDLKGHGDSDRPATGYRLEDQADEVSALIRALGLEEVTLMGHSWGGGISLEVATRRDLDIRRLVLEDPAVMVGNAPEQAAQRQEVVQMYVASVGISRQDAYERARPNLALGWTELDLAGKVDASVKGSPAAVMAVFKENGPWNLLDRFAEVRCPTLLIRAEVAHGGIVSEEAVERATANTLVRVVTLPDADHNIHRGRFDRFMAEVEAFLA